MAQCSSSSYMFKYSGEAVRLQDRLPSAVSASSMLAVEMDSKPTVSAMYESGMRVRRVLFIVLQVYTSLRMCP